LSVHGPATREPRQTSPWQVENIPIHEICRTKVFVDEDFVVVTLIEDGELKFPVGDCLEAGWDGQVQLEMRG
jgi:hypothetical protein